MSEKDVVDRSPRPFTRALLADDLRALGVRAGMTLLVHSSLSRIGYVPGGPVAVIQALQDVLTPAGTLMMPTHSSDYSDPAHWQHPPVPAAWQPIIRAETPAFDPQRTPSRGVGVIPELFRTWPDVVRSHHPAMSFAAWGKHAHTVTAVHSLSFGFGDHSPLGQLYALDGYVLLLGVGYGNNTSFHLGEARAGASPIIPYGAPIWENGRRVWKEHEDWDYNDDPFAQIGADYEAAQPVSVGTIGLAESRLFRQRTAVDFAEAWLKRRREAGS